MVPQYREGSSFTEYRIPNTELFSKGEKPHTAADTVGLDDTTIPHIKIENTA